jgi:hypothetical protein
MTHNESRRLCRRVIVIVRIVNIMLCPVHLLLSNRTVIKRIQFVGRLSGGGVTYL